jgi:hypothetical protein
VTAPLCESCGLRTEGKPVAVVTDYGREARICQECWRIELEAQEAARKSRRDDRIASIGAVALWSMVGFAIVFAFIPGVPGWVPGVFAGIFIVGYLSTMALGLLSVFGVFRLLARPWRAFSEWLNS